MSHTIRRIIFYSLVVIFLLITPPTILYSMGYSYNFSNNSIVLTGGIFLKTDQSGAKIIINDEKRGETPKLITRLLPKTYSVKIEKEGFHPWQKNLEVTEQLVTEARNIFLFPQKVEPQLIAQNATSTIEEFLRTDQENLNFQQAQNIASTTAGWLLKNNTIYYVSEIDSKLYRQNLDGSDKKTLSDTPLDKNHFTIITNNDENVFLIKSDSGTLYYLNPDTHNFRLISANVSGAEISGDNKKFLFWNNHEIWIYYLQEIQIQPYKKAEEQELITRFAQNISQAVFYPNNEYIAFVVADQIKIIEIDARDRRNSVDLQATSSPQIYYDSKNNLFYYLSNGQIFRIELI